MPENLPVRLELEEKILTGRKVVVISVWDQDDYEEVSVEIDAQTAKELFGRFLREVLK